MISTPGLEKMDSESRAQAVQGWLISEIEKLSKEQLELQKGHGQALNGHEKRIAELEAARERQISLNSDFSVQIGKLQVQAKQIVPEPNKSLIANLLNLLRRKK